MAAWATEALGGSPLEGVDEKLWLKVGREAVASDDASATELHLLCRALICLPPRLWCCHHPNKQPPWHSILRRCPALPCLSACLFQTFMLRRRAVLLSDRFWAEAIPRIDIYAWIMEVRAWGPVPVPVPAPGGLRWAVVAVAACAEGAEQAQRRAQHLSLHATRN